MSEQSEGILPEMDEQKLLGQIIDNIGSKEPDLTEAIRLCAIPHWFNAEILAWLRDEGSQPSERTETILDELKLKKLAFVRRPDDQSHIYHENVRNLLLRRWREEDVERFRKMNGKTAAYYASLLRSENISDEQRAEWEREEMYHLLMAGEQRGIEHFIRLSNRAIDSYRLSTLDFLLSMASEQADGLSAGHRLWIQFFRGKKDLLSGRWERALEAWESLKDERAYFAPGLEQMLAIHLSILYKDKGEWNKAIESFQDSLKILEKADDQRGMATLLNNRGFLYKDKGDWTRAEEDFEGARRKLETIGDARGMALSLKNLGLLYKDQGLWDEAVERLRSSLAILERVGDARGMAITYNDLGFLYKDQENWAEAIHCFQQSQKTLDKLGDEQGKAAAFNNLGFLYTSKQDWGRAEESFESASAILEKIGDARRRADTFSYLGILYRNKKEWEKADLHFQRALTVLTDMGDDRGKAVVLNNLGLLYQRKGDQEQAFDYFQQSLEIVEKVGDEMNAAQTMYELALLYEEMRRYDQAIELLAKVVKISDQVGHPDSRIRKSREKLEMVKIRQRNSRDD